MGDLKSPTWIYGKALLLLLTGAIAATLVLVEAPSLKVAFLLAITVWAFCRSYYFAFYVIQHYLEPGFRFSGFFSFAAWLWRQRRGRCGPTEGAD